MTRSTKSYLVTSEVGPERAAELSRDILLPAWQLSVSLAAQRMPLSLRPCKVQHHKTTTYSITFYKHCTDAIGWVTGRHTVCKNLLHKLQRFTLVRTGQTRSNSATKLS